MRQDIVDGRFRFVLIDTQADGRIGLRVHVDNERFFFGGSQAGGKVNCRCGFSDATFLIADRNYFAHLSPHL